jgi:hypothetical protein
MRCTVMLVSINFCAWAQLSMPVGIVHGNLISWTGSARSGQFSIQNKEHGVYSCMFDLRTYFERAHQIIAVTGLAAGDPLEVVADHKAGSENCYARTVHVIPTHPERAALWPLRTATSPTEDLFPRGNFLFGGRVVRAESAALVVKARSGEIRVVLRPDTRYSGDTAPPVNTHVFVRAGRDVDGLLEAYQIAWGEIITPQ